MIKQWCLVLILFQQALQLVETVIAECKSTALDSYRLIVLEPMPYVEKEMHLLLLLRLSTNCQVIVYLWSNL